MSGRRDSAIRGEDGVGEFEEGVARASPLRWRYL
jgi:hypothetical protein